MSDRLKNFKILETAEVPLSPHPQAQGVGLHFLVTEARDGGDLTLALVHLPAGCPAFPHSHENADDLIYVLQGRGRIQVAGLGTFALTPGTFVRIPKGVVHAPMDIEQDLLLYNAWSPAIR